MSKLCVPLQLSIDLKSPDDTGPLGLKVIRECTTADLDPDRPAEDQRFCLFDESGTDLLGRFATREQAEEAERRAERFGDDSKQDESGPVNAAAGGAIASVEGHASVFNVVDLGNDVVRRGAFAKSIVENDGRVPLFWEHSHSLFGKGDSMPLGVTSLLEEDSHGLFFRGEIADTTKGRDLIALMDTIGLRSSIGFEIRDEVLKDNSGATVRELLDLRLMEISIVTWPANPATTALVVGNSADDQMIAGIERLASILGG